MHHMTGLSRWYLTGSLRNFLGCMLWWRCPCVGTRRKTLEALKGDALSYCNIALNLILPYHLYFTHFLLLNKYVVFGELHSFRNRVIQGHEDFVSAIEGLDTFGGSSQSCLVATGDAALDWIDSLCVCTLSVFVVCVRVCTYVWVCVRTIHIFIYKRSVRIRLCRRIRIVCRDYMVMKKFFTTSDQI